MENCLPTLHAFSFGPYVVEDILAMSRVRRPKPRRSTWHAQVHGDWETAEAGFKPSSAGFHSSPKLALYPQRQPLWPKA